MGGGAAGFELDSVNPKYGTPPHAVVVAESVAIHPDYGETAAGGAVFSVGSMTYAGSLDD